MTLGLTLIQEVIIPAATVLLTLAVASIAKWTPRQIDLLKERMNNVEKTALTEEKLEKILDRVVTPLNKIQIEFSRLSERLISVEKDLVSESKIESKIANTLQSSEVMFKEINGTVHGFYKKLDIMSKDFQEVNTRTRLLEVLYQKQEKAIEGKADKG